MYDECFLNLGAFFGAYLHQDFDIHADTFEGVARNYAETSSHKDVRDTLGELCVLAEMPGGDSAIAALLQDFHIGVNLAHYEHESAAVRSLANAMAVAFTERLQREQQGQHRGGALR